MMYQVKLYQHTEPTRLAVEEMTDPPRFLAFCKQCPNYGNTWSCPPLNFDGREYLQNFPYIHLLAAQIVFTEETINAARTKEEQARFCRESVLAVRNVVGACLLQLENETRLSISGGNCHLCETCARLNGEPCVQPEKMRYAFNAFGFDVTKLLSQYFSIELKWPGDGLPPYLTSVCAMLSQDPAEDFLAPLEKAFAEKGVAAKIVQRGCGA